MNKVILLFILIIALCTPCFAQSNMTESLSITTYYPAPYGVYRNLKLSPTDLVPSGGALTPGVMYYNNSADVIRYFNKTGQWVNLTGGGGGGTAGGWEHNTTSGHVYNVNTGHIGIGTNNPSRKLTIVGTATDLVKLQLRGPHPDFELVDTQVPSGVQISNDGNLLEILRDDAGDSGFSSTSYLMAIDIPSGNVGIGHSNPRCKLHLGLPEASLPGGSIAPGIADFYKYQILLCSCASAHQSYGLGVMGDGTGLFFNSPYGYTFFRIGTEESPFLTMLPQNSSGTCKRVGIQTRTPTHILDVQGTVNDNQNRVNSRQGYLTNGSDYAEYFVNEEPIRANSVVGLNPSTGKVRVYREGDELVGILSSSSGFIGNSKEEIAKDKNYSLVGLLGQLDFDKSQVNIKSRKVFTKDNKFIGLLLSNGKIFLR